MWIFSVSTVQYPMGEHQIPVFPGEETQFMHFRFRDVSRCVIHPEHKNVIIWRTDPYHLVKEDGLTRRMATIHYQMALSSPEAALEYQQFFTEHKGAGALKIDVATGAVAAPVVPPHVRQLYDPIEAPPEELFPELAAAESEIAKQEQQQEGETVSGGLAPAVETEEDQLTPEQKETIEIMANPPKGLKQRYSLDREIETEPWLWKERDEKMGSDNDRA
eukprot:TRINITY_DN66972_c2_g3_i2.p2 TRINITY_DN66972_c2_g3~~TRINITY_DN66972_c2_g3_i2.p2  ORF type:complete len:219 (+),score=21.19 TRINITY_DN66972_c2_g3_i2:234-890(+)